MLLNNNLERRFFAVADKRTRVVAPGKCQGDSLVDIGDALHKGAAVVVNLNFGVGEVVVATHELQCKGDAGPGGVWIYLNVRQCAFGCSVAVNGTRSTR